MILFLARNSAAFLFRTTAVGEKCMYHLHATINNWNPPETAVSLMDTCEPATTRITAAAALSHHPSVSHPAKPRPHMYQKRLHMTEMTEMNVQHVLVAEGGVPYLQFRSLLDKAGQRSLPCLQNVAYHSTRPQERAPFLRVRVHRRRRQGLLCIYTYKDTSEPCISYLIREITKHQR